MLTKNFPNPARGYICAKQQAGIVLIIALIVLVAMTLAAIGLVRSVDTNNMIAGNLAFQQAATHSADIAAEDAITWLQAKNATAAGLDIDDATRGYSASGSNAAQNPSAGQSWDAFWTATLANRAYAFSSGAGDAAGNTVAYVIDRMCNNAGGKTAGASCVASPVVTTVTGNSEEGGEIQLAAPSVVYYRITARVAGPKSTVSYVQVMVSM